MAEKEMTSEEAIQATALHFYAGLRSCFLQDLKNIAEAAHREGVNDGIKSEQERVREELRQGFLALPKS